MKCRFSFGAESLIAVGMCDWIVDNKFSYGRCGIHIKSKLTKTTFKAGRVYTFSVEEWHLCASSSTQSLLLSLYLCLQCAYTLNAIICPSIVLFDVVCLVFMQDDFEIVVYSIYSMWDINNTAIRKFIAQYKVPMCIVYMCHSNTILVYEIADGCRRRTVIISILLLLLLTL